MKNLKSIFVAATLALVTVSVFAGAKKFSADIYAYKASNDTYILVGNINSWDGTNFSTSTGTAPAKITDATGASLPLFEGQSQSTPVHALVTF